MGFVVGVDGATDLGDPEFYAVVDEQRQCEAELVAVEGAVRFADDDGGKPAMGVTEGGE